MRSRSVEAGCGGKYSSQSSFCVVTAAQATTGAARVDNRRSMVVVSCLGWPRGGSYSPIPLVWPRGAPTPQNALYQKMLVGNLRASNAPRELVEARSVVQRCTPAEPALLMSFLRLTGVIGRSTRTFS